MLQIIVSTAVALTIFVLMSGLNISAREKIERSKKKLGLESAIEANYGEVANSVNQYDKVADFWNSAPGDTESPAGKPAPKPKPKSKLQESAFKVDGIEYKVLRTFHPLKFDGKAKKDPDYIRVDVQIFQGSTLIASKSKFFVDKK